jgi:hypothetical protein
VRSKTERRLLAQALIVVPLVRVALWLLPFRMVRRWVARRTQLQPASPVTAAQVIRAVLSVAARVPRATCLTQALAASLLLPRYGHDATLRVGVAKDDDGRLRAHAWLEIDGAAILGEPKPGAFHAFPPLVLS